MNYHVLMIDKNEGNCVRVVKTPILVHISQIILMYNECIFQAFFYEFHDFISFQINCLLHVLEYSRKFV